MLAPRILKVSVLPTGTKTAGGAVVIRSLRLARPLLVATSGLLAVACSTTQPLKPAQEEELFALYTCARYYHVIADPDTGDEFVEAASEFGSQARIAPEDMIAVYLRARGRQAASIEEYALSEQGSGQSSGDDDNTKPRTMAEALGDSAEVNQLDTIDAANALYAEQCAALKPGSGS